MSLSDIEKAKLVELVNKSKNGRLTPLEAAEFKQLQRKDKKTSRQAEASKSPTTNVFGKVATTKISPTPVRLLQIEKAALKTRADTLISEDPELVISELGQLREVNNSKLIRAAIWLLKDVSNKELISAIKEVQMNMIRYKD